MARPIITTDAPGCRETVLNEENGFLVEVGNVEELVEKMEWFIHNKEMIPRMGKKSLEYCQEKFEVGKINSNMLEIMNIR